MGRLFYLAFLCFASLLLIGLVTGCKSGLRLKNVDTSGFKKSTKSAESLSAELTDKYGLNEALCFEGKAKITVRTTDENDTGSSDFMVCENEAYFRIKNRLGIEGLRIWQQQDSLYIYDLIKKEAFALHHNNLVDPRLNALAAIDLFNLLVPIPKAPPSQALESATEYLLVFEDGQNWLFDKTNLDLVTVIKPVSRSTTDRIQFYNYAEQVGLRFPTKMALLNSTEQTNIFIQLQRLATTQKNEAVLELNIPASISLQR